MAEQPLLPCNRHEEHVCTRCKDAADKLSPTEKNQFWDKYGPEIRKGLVGAFVGTVVGVAAVAPFVGLGLYGFTSTGIAALSRAAIWQSAIGNVAAGSWFSALQSLGTWASVSVTTGATVAAGSGVVGGVVNVATGSASEPCVCAVCGVILP
jgi:hypothetical protein